MSHKHQNKRPKSKYDWSTHDWSTKQRYTRLASDSRRGLATTCATGVRSPRPNYPRYDIAYTNSVYRYNYKQIKTLRRKIKRFNELLKTNNNKTLRDFRDTYTRLLAEVVESQYEIGDITGCRIGKV